VITTVLFFKSVYIIAFLFQNYFFVPFYFTDFFLMLLKICSSGTSLREKRLIKAPHSMDSKNN
jgi:hypothetical protein